LGLTPGVKLHGMGVVDFIVYCVSCCTQTCPASKALIVLIMLCCLLCCSWWLQAVTVSCRNTKLHVSSSNRISIDGVQHAGCPKQPQSLSDCCILALCSRCGRSTLTAPQKYLPYITAVALEMRTNASQASNFSSS
jgi:hypothetical protein